MNINLISFWIAILSTSITVNIWSAYHATNRHTKELFCIGVCWRCAASYVGRTTSSWTPSFEHKAVIASWWTTGKYTCVQCIGRSVPGLLPSANMFAKRNRQNIRSRRVLLFVCASDDRPFRSFISVPLIPYDSGERRTIRWWKNPSADGGS